jgi:hypothetical protein
LLPPVTGAAAVATAVQADSNKATNSRFILALGEDTIT